MIHLENVASGYTGTVHFSSSDNQAVLPASDYTFANSDHGVHVFTNSVDTQDGSCECSQTVTVSDAANGLSNSAGVNVNAASAGSLTLTAPGSSPAGSAFSVTVTAHDQFGNIANGYTGTVHFSRYSDLLKAVLPAPDYTFIAADHGVHTFTNGVTLNTIGGGSQTVTAADAANSLTDASVVNVTAAAAQTLMISAPGTTTAGSPFSVTVTALDKNSNIATSYTGTVHFSSSDGQAVLPAPDYTFTAADHGVHVFTNVVTLKTVAGGSQTVTVSDAANSFSSFATVAVTPATVDHFVVAAGSSEAAAIAFGVTVTAMDAFNNIVTAYSGTVHFTSTDSQATLPADATLSNGTATFNVTLFSAGSQTVTATDKSNSAVHGTSNAVTVTLDADHGYIQELYQTVLHRSGSYTELSGWVANLMGVVRTSQWPLRLSNPKKAGQISSRVGMSSIWAGKRRTVKSNRGWDNWPTARPKTRCSPRSSPPRNSRHTPIPWSGLRTPTPTLFRPFTSCCSSAPGPTRKLTAGSHNCRYWAG